MPWEAFVSSSNSSRRIVSSVEDESNEISFPKVNICFESYYFKKDDNIHKSEALEIRWSDEQTKILTCQNWWIKKAKNHCFNRYGIKYRVAANIT